MNWKGIDPDAIKKESDAGRCEEMLKPIFLPLNDYPHIRPPTLEEVQHYLYQKLYKRDVSFYRRFQHHRHTRQINTPKEKRVELPQHKGAHAKWPKEDTVVRLTRGLKSYNLDISALQHCTSPLLLAKYVLPLLVGSGRSKTLTHDHMVQARRLLQHLLWKPKTFIDEVLDHAADFGLTSGGNRLPSIDEDDGEEVSGSGPGASSHEEAYSYQPELIGGNFYGEAPSTSEHNLPLAQRTQPYSEYNNLDTNSWHPSTKTAYDVFAQRASLYHNEQWPPQHRQQKYGTDEAMNEWALQQMQDPPQLSPQLRSSRMPAQSGNSQFHPLLHSHGESNDGVVREDYGQYPPTRYDILGLCLTRLPTVPQQEAGYSRLSGSSGSSSKGQGRRRPGDSSGSGSQQYSLPMN